MMNINPSQRAQIFKLCNACRINDEERHLIVMSITNERTEHLKELYFVEANKMIEILRKRLNEIVRTKNTAYQTGQRLRRNIFRLFYDLGYISNEMDTNGKIAVIEERINSLSKINKPFNSLSVEELEKVINQFQAIHRRYGEREENRANLN